MDNTQFNPRWRGSGRIVVSTCSGYEWDGQSRKRDQGVP